MKYGAVLLHGHHENSNGCPLSLVESAQSRVVEIETQKPEAERATRLLLLREVDVSELPHADAWDAYVKASAAYAPCLLSAEWGEWHAEHCGAYKMGLCKWTPEHPRIF